MHVLKVEKNWDLLIWRTWLIQWALQASSEAFGKLYTFVRLLPLEIQEFTGVGLTPRDQDVWILNSKAFVHTFTFLVDKNFGKLKIFLNWFFSVFLWPDRSQIMISGSENPPNREEVKPGQKTKVTIAAFQFSSEPGWQWQKRHTGTYYTNNTDIKQKNVSFTALQFFSQTLHWQAGILLTKYINARIHIIKYTQMHTYKYMCQKI